ncbi:hypothetical protein BDY21DRAFT_264860, partial [Lineolata rhizophorae]
HPWTDEELNLISYLKLYHNWTWSRIRNTYLPFMSSSAISTAYTRITDEDRVYRASIVATLTKRTSNTANTLSINYHETLARASSSRRRSSRVSRSTRTPAPRPRDYSETVVILSSSEDENKPITHKNTTTRYNLRKKRLTVFRDSGPQYSVDRERFPHFYRACEKHSELRKVPDRDYEPPSHSPTPNLSDRSPSIISSELSDASSLELFGLEARPVTSSNHTSSVASS